MKIVYCVIDCSFTGGIERVISGKANYLADALGYDVTIITANQGDKPNFYPFSTKIKFIDLGIKYDELEQYPFLKRLVEQIKKRKQHSSRLSEVLKKIKADIVISTYSYEYTLLPSIRDGSKRICEFHFSQEYRQIENRYNRQSFFTKLFSGMAERRKYLFIDRYDKFVVLTQSDLKSWENNHPNVTQIYNILPFKPEQSADLDAKRIISVGRLTTQKGFNRLIEAFRLVNQSHPDWHLDIYGSGEDEECLTALIEKYHLEKVVRLISPTQNIIKEYLNSSILAMTSRYEGFPMVLTEAMACGVPCISFDCPHGPSEIITDGEDGFLVETGNVTQFADRMMLLMADAELRKEMGRKAKRNIQRFSPEVIMKQWDKLFHEI
ncbi:glycosyl transferase [Bacteroidia bacterium]|nr:glycosyl transferase [Bacteroidia bacterium]